MLVTISKFKVPAQNAAAVAERFRNRSHKVDQHDGLSRPRSVAHNRSQSVLHSNRPVEQPPGSSTISPVGRLSFRAQARWAGKGRLLGL